MDSEFLLRVHGYIVYNAEFTTLVDKNFMESYTIYKIYSKYRSGGFI